MASEAVRFTIRGIVQGVGFRPFVHRIAHRCRLAGRVHNRAGSVIVHAEGSSEDLDAFRRLLVAEAPPSTRIVRVVEKRIAPEGHTTFAIVQSDPAGEVLSTIPPDIALCPLCSVELGDPSNRRYRYPFINCTNCGPRFTIVTALPYDRGNTSMAVFPLCAECQREYEDSSDRRFHAEPVACPVCGPSIEAREADGRYLQPDDPIRFVAEALRAGRIAAIRGLGGFHLAADATDDDAVQSLRERKHREEKPFAVMVRNMATARLLASLSAADEEILASPSAPVLLADQAKGSSLSPRVAPGLHNVGIFLPYTPLHRLLLDMVDRPLVMTSGNVTDEPIATGNEEALERLSGIADIFLLHNREIIQRSDDSVVRRVGRTIYPIRRARGLVPAPIVIKPPSCGGRHGTFRKVPLMGRHGSRGSIGNVPSSAFAGLGAEIKNTFCILKGGFAYLSQHIGDLEHATVRDFYADTFRFFRTFLDVDLAAVCRDLHPGYFTTSFAGTVGADRILSLQHHKAHLYSLMAETGFAGKAVGVAFDGTGYGEDGAIWGGEFFAIDGMEMSRAAHLDYFPLQGGDTVVKEPWKVALSLLRETLGPREGREEAIRLFRDIGPERVSLVSDAIEKNVNVVLSSSCGRLFDAASALAGICLHASYEGQAPMLLEGAARIGGNHGRYGFGVRDDGNGLLRVDWREAVERIVTDTRAGVPAPVIARRFHDGMTEMILNVTGRLGESAGTRHVLLSGGVFQNARLLNGLLTGLRKMKLKVLIHREVPANDGGICLGQAYYAANQIWEGR
ncbi:MAG: carbamoyltransferase HypF [Candidatus Deferrimicrobiaceae bacterium]